MALLARYHKYALLNVSIPVKAILIYRFVISTTIYFIFVTQYIAYADVSQWESWSPSRILQVKEKVKENRLRVINANRAFANGDVSQSDSAFANADISQSESWPPSRITKVKEQGKQNRLRVITAHRALEVRKSDEQQVFI